MLFAMHISDGVLMPSWLVGGFVVAGLLAFLGCWRIRDEEIPKIALLTAAFFLTSSLHIKVGPSSVHLLLNGLVGVLLGWRAALAIPVGLLLQAVLLLHGGFWSLGINSCVQVLPALAAGFGFSALRRLPGLQQPGIRAALVTLSTLVWLVSLVYSATLLATNGLRRIDALDLTTANAITFHPATLLGTLLLSLLAAWGERRLENAPEFPLGLVIGEGTVLLTLALNCVVLLLGGETDWLTPTLVLVVMHLPLAVLEGAILGFTVGFLAKVKPELLGLPVRYSHDSSTAITVLADRGADLHPAAAVDAPRAAHRLNGSYQILPDRKIHLEAWFSTNQIPKGAKVRVYRANEETPFLEPGELDADGALNFTCPTAEDLRVEISAGEGHRKILFIGAGELAGNQPTLPSGATRNEADVKDLLLGLALIISIASFTMNILQARQLRALSRQQKRPAEQIPHHPPIEVRR